MTQQLKNDIRTIIELLSYLILLFCVSFITAWIFIPLFLLSLGNSIYSRYYKRTSKDILVFPTLNDESLKMIPISFSIIILIFSVIGYFAFNLKFYYSIVGVMVGVSVFLFGFFELPQGWVSVENYTLKLYGIQGDIDARQLKEITLKNDKITLTNIYGEHKHCGNLNLNPITAGNIKRFIKEKFPKIEILVIDHVLPKRN